MTWTNKYWDIVDQFYWTPSYLGLKSIPRHQWVVDGDTVSIPKELTHSTGPLYRRLRSGDEYWQFVRRQEETFNHLFDLTFAVLPGDVVCDLLGPMTSAGKGHDYESLGREICDRYFWGGENVTTPDGLFLAPESVLAVELKFNAKTSLDQLAKYMMIFVAEEQVAGRRESLDLLYIFNSDPVAAFKTQTGLAPDEIGARLAPILIDAAKGQIAREFLNENQAALVGVLERANVSCISWLDLRNTMVTFAERLGDGQGDRTLRSLISGFASAIAEHPLSNVDSDPLHS